MRAVSLPEASRAPDRKDSTPRHGRLLHPSPWAERDDRDHAAENFFQGGNPKQATPLTAPATSLTTRNRFTPSFRGWGLDENLKLKSPPYRGSHIDVRWQDKNEVGLAARAAMPRTRPGTSIHGHRDATMMLVAYRHGLRASEVCDLQWQQIELSEGRLHVHRVKNGIPSVHPISGD